MGIIIFSQVNSKYIDFFLKFHGYYFFSFKFLEKLGCKVFKAASADLKHGPIHQYFVYFIFRSFFEDTLAFVSIDLLLLGIASVLIKHNIQHGAND